MALAIRRLLDWLWSVDGSILRPYRAEWLWGGLSSQGVALG
jgi:hypothetical protein